MRTKCERKKWNENNRWSAQILVIFRLLNTFWWWHDCLNESLMPGKVFTQLLDQKKCKFAPNSDCSWYKSKEFTLMNRFEILGSSVVMCELGTLLARNRLSTGIFKFPKAATVTSFSSSANMGLYPWVRAFGRGSFFVHLLNVLKNRFKLINTSQIFHQGNISLYMYARILGCLSHHGILHSRSYTAP